MITNDRADVCVVGAGLSGSLVAGGLARLGHKVVVLEAGPDHHGAFAGDEVAHIVDGRMLHAEPEVLVLEDGAPQVGTFLARNVGVAGPFVWSGFAYRFHPSDFRAATASGAPDGSSVADWPLTYDDLAPWYDRAEALLAVGGVTGENPFEAPRRGPYPEAPVPQSAGAARLAAAARALHWHPYHPPAAVLTRPRQDVGRGACTGCGLCTFYGCPWGAKASVGATELGAVLRDQVEVRAGCTATEVRCDPAGRPVAVRYADARGDKVEQPAGVVVLALNAPYVARLMLLSRGPAHPRGLGNDHDLVGRHLTFHTGFVTYGVYEDVIHCDRGPAPQVGVDDHNEDRPWRAGAGFRRGGVLHGGVPAAFTGGPLAFARGLDRTIPLPEGVPRYGDGLLRFASWAYPRHQAVFGLGEDLPQPGNRVTLDPLIRDSLGLPALRIEYSAHPEDLAQQRYLLERALELLRASGALTTAGALSSVPGGVFAGHAHGTTRMGADPTTSVTDDYGRVHGTDNLFVTGAGPFVTSAGLNPALTVAALALRAVNEIGSAASAARE
jgi:choline dehydrogenase-like flavoprotein